MNRIDSRQTQPLSFTGTIAGKAVMIPVMLAILLAFSVRSDAETRVYNGVEYFVPDGFESKRQEILENLENATASARLMDELDALEQMYDGLVDLIVTPEGSEDKVGFTIMVYPVEPDDVSDQEYLDNVFAAMERYAANAAAAGVAGVTEKQFRTVGIADTPGHFSRMDVAEAYGLQGNHATFLIKAEEGWNVELIILGNRDLNSPEIDAVIDSIRLVDR